MSDSQGLVGGSSAAGNDSLERSQATEVELEVELGSGSDSKEQPKGSSEAPPEDEVKEDVPPPAPEAIRDPEEAARRARKEEQLKNSNRPSRVRITEDR